MFNEEPDGECKQQLAELRAKLNKAKESEQCWITNAKNLQVGYNELEAKHREAKLKLLMKG